MPTTAVDPICGLPVDPATARTLHRGGQSYSFCSDYCRREFLRSTRGAPAREARPSRRVAYLSMEIAADARFPTYAGGLGVLAGDLLRSCADLHVPIVGVTLAHRDGYFVQVLDASGRQSERPAPWAPERALEELPARAAVQVSGRTVVVRAFRYPLVGIDGYEATVLFLDTDLPENDARDRALSHQLYGGDDEYRLGQEIVLGIGGVRLLEAIGYTGLRHYHLNEGHAALAGLELLRRCWLQRRALDVDVVRERCVFTTHTPVPAAFDRFPYPMAVRVLGDLVPADTLQMLAGPDELNMTRLALSLSGRVNGVAASHELVSRHQFPGRDVRHITNGVHSVRWTSAPFSALYDRHVPHWREDPTLLRKALSIPTAEIRQAHREAKGALLERARAATGRALRPEALTLGFARRATGYKRPGLLFRDLERLRALGRGRLQLVFAGKAHPRDEEGKRCIQEVIAAGRALGEDVPLAFLPDYDLDLAREIVSGVDVWLNTPLRPLEASGTSGMKAAHNGVPSLSVLDGWWVEGWIEDVTGWSIGAEAAPLEPEEGADERDAADLYGKLERTVLPGFYGPEEPWLQRMRQVIALNASVFNSHRMVQQYVTLAYLP